MDYNQIISYYTVEWVDVWVVTLAFFIDGISDYLSWLNKVYYSLQTHYSIDIYYRDC